MGAVVGMLVVGVLVVVYLLLSRQNSNPPPSLGAVDQQPTAITSSNNAAGQPTTASMNRTSDPNSTPNPNVTPAGLQTMAAVRPATGLGTPMPDEGNTHVADTEPITYKNYPPTSGTHYGTPASAGFFDKTVPEGQFVHSLEHGYIVLYYKPDLPDATKQQLKDLSAQLPLGKYGKVKLVIVPYTHMDTPLAIAAWDRLLPLASYNADEIKTFYQQWVDKGPEDVP